MEHARLRTSTASILCRSVVLFGYLLMCPVAFGASYTVIFQGTHPLKSVVGYPSFSGIRKMKFVFASKSSLPMGQCSYETGTMGNWTFVSYSDGVNSYSRVAGFMSPVMPSGWAFDSWYFEACLDSLGNFYAGNASFRVDNFSTENDLSFDPYISSSFSQFLGPSGNPIGAGYDFSYMLYLDNPENFFALDIDGIAPPILTYRATP